MNQTIQNASTPSAPKTSCEASPDAVPASPDTVPEKGALSLVRIEIAEIAKAIARTYAARESLAKATGPLHRV